METFSRGLGMPNGKRSIRLRGFSDLASGKDGKIQEEHTTGARHNQTPD